MTNNTDDNSHNNENSDNNDLLSFQNIFFRIKSKKAVKNGALSLK